MKKVNNFDFSTVDLESYPGFKDAKMKVNDTDVKFFESLGYKTSFPMGTVICTHESLCDISRHEGNWYYRQPKNWIKIESDKHLLNIIRAHKLKKIMKWEN